MRLAAKLVAVAVVATSAVFGAVRFATSSRGIDRTGLRNVKEISYFPSANAWTNMWLNWNPAQIDRDFARIASLHANTVRVIVQPSAMGSFPAITSTRRGEFDQILTIAADHGLQVQLTLFDLFGNYSEFSYSQQWIESLISPVANDPRIAFIELQNELDPRNAAAITWARAEMPVLRAAAGSILVTISVPGNLGVAGLAALDTALGPALPDFWDFHYYGSSADAYSTLAQAVQVAAPLSLYIGETGLSTYTTGTPTPAQMRAAQEAYLARVQAATVALLLPPPAVWTLNDFVPSAVPATMSEPPTELDFGLYDIHGQPKPAAQLVSDFFGSGRVRVLP